MFNEETFEKLDKFAAEANKNAVEHGWWETERDNRELIALIHSEISEALEEFRNKQQMAYIKDGKPEGQAVELIDMVIRICDFMAHHGMKFGYEERECDLCTDDELPVLVAKLHSLLGNVMTEGDIDWATGEIQNDHVAAVLTSMVEIAFDWIEGKKIDPWYLLDNKHYYNKSRPYRHGNKLC